MRAAGAANLNALLSKTLRDCNDDVACAAIGAAAAARGYFGQRKPWKTSATL